MIDYLAESVLIAFTMGALLGGVVATHLASRSRRPAMIELMRRSRDRRAARLARVRVRND